MYRSSLRQHHPHRLNASERSGAIRRSRNRPPLPQTIATTTPLQAPISRPVYRAQARRRGTAGINIDGTYNNQIGRAWFLIGCVANSLGMHMIITVQQLYADKFQEVLYEEQLGDPALFLDVDVFDEVPVYSRIHQLDFLSGLSFAKANNILVRLTALYLGTIVSYAAKQEGQKGKTILRMVSVTGWLNENDSGEMNFDGSMDFVRPNIWLANLDNPKLSDFSVWPAVSLAGLFVGAAMNDDDRFAVVEGPPERFGAPSPARVYIYMPGSQSADRLRLNSGS